MKENGSFSNNLPSNQLLLKSKNCVTKSTLGYYIPPNSIPFTKIYKSNTITGGESGKNTKRNQKKSNVADNLARVGKIRNPLALNCNWVVHA